MKKTQIDLIGIYLDEAFPEGWASQISYTTGEEEEIMVRYTETFSDFEKKVLYAFIRSILSGEYIIRLNLNNRIELLRDRLQIDLPAEEREEVKAKIYKRATSILNHLDYTLKRYRLFIESIINQYSLSQIHYVFNVYRYKGHPQNKSIFQNIYDILFLVAETDHRLSYDSKRIKELILSHKTLEDIIINNELHPDLMPAIKAMDGKCLFLLKKLLIYDMSGVDYMVDFKAQHLDVNILKQSWLKRLEEQFEFYRMDNTSGVSYGKELDRMSYNKQLRVSLYPLLMKYNKDYHSESLGQINNIISEFNSRYLFLKNKYCNRPYDLYAINTLKSYMYNSRLSFKLRSGEYTITDLQIDMNEIINVQQEIRIVDYYPFMIAAEYLEKMIEDKEKSDLDLSRTMFQLMNKYVHRFEESYLICSQQSFYPLQSLYNDSLNPYDSFGAVFIASSYCRPVQYSKVKERLEALQTKCLLCKNIIHLKEERLEIESIKKGIDHSKKQTIEIISVYTAIITFLFGTIDFFASGKSGSFVNQIYNIISLGIILLLFVSSIAVLTTRHEDVFRHYFKHTRVWLSIVSILVLLSLLIYLIVCVSPNVIAE